MNIGGVLCLAIVVLWGCQQAKPPPEQPTTSNVAVDTVEPKKTQQPSPDIKAGTQPNSTQQGTPMATPKQPMEPTGFVSGPTLEDEAELLKWLNTTLKTSDNPQRHIKLPVVARFDDRRQRIKEAFIGVQDAKPGADAVFLKLNDSRMGISLMRRLKGKCPKDTTACVVWLEGQWGASGPGARRKKEDTSGDGPKRWPFAVRVVHELIETPPVGDDARIFVAPPAL